MKLSQQSQSLIESTIKQAIGKYACCPEQTTITDIHLQPNSNTGELIIFDDDDEELATAVIDQWLTYDDDNFCNDCERVFRSILTKMKDNGEFENLSIIVPFSFVLVDEDKETISELLLIDDDTMLVNDELLKGLDEELDAFLQDLLNT